MQFKRFLDEQRRSHRTPKRYEVGDQILAYGKVWTILEVGVDTGQLEYYAETWQTKKGTRTENMWIPATSVDKRVE